MRFLEIEIENINSLKGKHRICFQDLAKESELFAITGPTGSGKSTILQSISMAMYSEHPKKLTAKDIVTTGQPYGKIDLKFEHHRKVYDVHWECQVLKKNGEPKKNPTTTRVFKCGHNILEEKVEDIVGLNYSQFSKVVILNQGQFSQFLTSPFKERKDILEKLLDDKNLKNLAITLRKNLKELALTLSHQEEIIKITKILSAQEEKEAQDKKSTLKESLDKLIIQSEILADLHKGTEKLEEVVTKQEEIRERSHIKNQEKSDLYKKLGTSNQSLTQKQSALQKLKTDYKERLPLIDEAINNLSQQKKFSTDLEKLEKDKQVILAEIRDKNEKALQSQKAITEIEAKLKELTDISLDDEEKYIADNKALTEINRVITQLTSLEKIQDVIKSDLTSIEDEANNLKAESENIQQQRIDLFKDEETSFDEVIQQLEKDVETESALLQKHEMNKDKIGQFKKEIEGLDSQINELEHELSNIKNNQKILEEKALKINEDREEYLFLQHALKQGPLKDHQCPLCEHLIDPDRVKDIQKTVDQRSNIESDFEQLCHEEKALEIEQIKISTQLNLFKENYRKNTKNLDLLQIGFKEFDSQKLSLLKTKLEKARQSSESLNLLDQQKKSIETQLSTLRNRWKNISNECNKNSNEITKSNKDIENLRHSLHYPVHTLEINTKTLENISQKKILTTQLQAQCEKKLVYEESLTLNKEKETQNALENSTINKNLERLRSEFSQKKLPLQPHIERESKHKEIEEAEEQFQLEQKRHQEIETSYSKVSAALTLLKEQSEENNKLLTLYSSQLKSIFDNCSDHSFLSQFEKLAKFLQGPIDESISSLPLADLRKGIISERITEVNTLLDQTKKEITVIETQLHENNKKKNELKAIEEEKKKKENLHSRLEKLSPYIDKDKFRDYALEILEKNLLRLANKEISSLADGRYQLLHAQAGQRSELLVLDLWQSNAQRKVSTLSGGETFLLSLGLALGLSEMTRGQTEIGSFFIDEGFGTLDEESINQVLECLLKMESYGKQIGVISHIKGLTQQIPVRLNLKKNHFGEAQISIN